MIKVDRELDSSKAHIHLKEPDKSEDEAEWTNTAIKNTKENKIGMSYTTW